MYATPTASAKVPKSTRPTPRSARARAAAKGFVDQGATLLFDLTGATSLLETGATISQAFERPTSSFRPPTPIEIFSVGRGWFKEEPLGENPGFRVTDRVVTSPVQDCHSGLGAFSPSPARSPTAPPIPHAQLISEDALALAIHRPQAARISAHGLMAVIQ